MEQPYISFNQDFQIIVSVKAGSEKSMSPMKGVQRILLERQGDQVARRATSIVTYQPQSSFSSHVHQFGEQFLVLEGVFSDFTGHYSAGWYVRNGVKSAHAPYSKQGTKIFVKLGQMPQEQTQSLQLNTNILDYNSISQTIRQLIIYESKYEAVSLYKIAKFGLLQLKNETQITEIFLIEGKIYLLETQLQKESWIRIPKGILIKIEGLQNSHLYIKIGKGIVRDKNWNQV